MKLSSSILAIALVANTSSSLFAAGPDRADYRREHDRFTPRASFRPEVSTPARTPHLQPTPQRPPVRATAASPAARFTISSHREKIPARAVITSKAARGAAAVPSEHRIALRPPRQASVEPRTFARVDQFQPASGSAASVQIARMPSLARHGSAKLNRFVFRRATPSSTTVPRNVVRAGGESPASR